MAFVNIQAAFQSRIRVYYAWKNAENDLLRTKQTHEKNRAQGRIPTERLGFSLNQIADVSILFTPAYTPFPSPRVY